MYSKIKIRQPYSEFIDISVACYCKRESSRSLICSSAIKRAVSLSRRPGNGWLALTGTSPVKELNGPEFYGALD